MELLRDVSGSLETQEVDEQLAETPPLPGAAREIRLAFKWRDQVRVAAGTAAAAASPRRPAAATLGRELAFVPPLAPSLPSPALFSPPTALAPLAPLAPVALLPSLASLAPFAPLASFPLLPRFPCPHLPPPLPPLPLLPPPPNGREANARLSS